MIESVSLEIWTLDGENVEIELEPWQVVAIVKVLGLKISQDPTVPNAYNIAMSTPETVSIRLKKMKLSS